MKELLKTVLCIVWLGVTFVSFSAFIVGLIMSDINLSRYSLVCFVVGGAHCVAFIFD
jgi:hypothetical protein